MTSTRFITIFLFLLPMLLASELHAQTSYKKHGRNVIKDAQGNVSVGHTKNFLREGKWYESYPDHMKKSFGKYHLGNPEGRHLYYWPNGKLSAIRDFTAGKHNGHFISFNANGDTIEHLTFATNMLHGYYYKYDSPSGTKTWGTYLNGKKSGWWSSSDGVTTDSCEYKGGKKDGQRITRTAPDQYSIGYYADDVEDSIWQDYVNGKLSREYWYYKGKNYKYDRVYFPESGSLSSELRFSAPSEVEVYFELYSSGVSRKTEWYSHNHLDSILEYYPNGSIHFRYHYRTREFGLRQIITQYKAYDSLGRIAYTIYCGADGSDSIRSDYNLSGSVAREIIYDHGSVRGQKFYYANGKPMLLFSSETIFVYSETGKQLKSGTPAYSKIFSKLDSMESALSVAMPLPPIIVALPLDPSVPDPDFVNPVELPDRMPEFPGGADSLRAFVSRNINYPTHERDAGNEAVVRIQFIVEKDGSLTGARALQETKTVSTAFTREALRVVKLMPNWSPGSVNGIRVRTLMTLPVVFRLQ